MESIKSDEALRIFLIGLFGEKLDKHAILKGGMVLRLLQCPRYTNDLDYVFIPFDSKKKIIPLIQIVLSEIPEIKLEHRFHSTNAQCDVILKNQFGIFKTQMEVNAAEDCEMQSLSTSDLALHYNQSPHIVRVMRFDVMLAHKLAAWNERRLMRDLYDIYFIYKFLGELPHLPTLKKRLQKIQYAKRAFSKEKPQQMALEDFLALLEKEAKEISEKGIEMELRDYLSQNESVGLDKKIRIAILQMVDALKGKM